MRGRGGGEAGGTAGSAGARETPNPAWARQPPGPRVASVPGTAALPQSRGELSPLPAARRVPSLGEAPTATARPSPAARASPDPAPPSARGCQRQQRQSAAPQSAAQRRRERAGGKRLWLAAPLRSAESLPRSRPALTAPRSRSPAPATTPPGRRSAPPPSFSGRGEGPQHGGAGAAGSGDAGTGAGAGALRSLRAEEEALLQDDPGARQALLRRARARRGAGTLLGPAGRAGVGWPRSRGTGGRGSAGTSLEPLYVPGTRLSPAVALTLH